MFSTLWNQKKFVRAFKSISAIENRLGGTNDEYEY